MHVAGPMRVQFHLLGPLDFDQSLALQRRVAYEAAAAEDPGIVVLLCEHRQVISVGRDGSRGHIRLTGEQLRLRGLETRWVARGGGCVLHMPGQIAVYPIVPLDRLGWSVGSYLERFRDALATTLEQFGARVQTRAGRFGVWGRTGQLAAMGAAVRHGVAHQGAFVNVNPPLTHFRYVDTAAGCGLNGRQGTMSCLLAEKRRPVTMQAVRAALIEQLGQSLAGGDFDLTTGHPFVSFQQPSIRAARAS